MVRAALWAVMTCAVASSCGHEDRAPAAQPGAPAGKVLEVSGSVRVGTKQLGVGDRVKTDDLIETGADGNVVIELAHNHARWELGPNLQVRPTESIAWTQERHGSAAQVDQDTSAAGRPAERSAADTGTSAHTGAPAETAPAPSAPPTAQPAPRRVTAAPARAVAAPPPPPPPPSTETSRGPSVRDGEAAGDSLGHGAALTADTFAKLSSCVPEGSRVHVKIHVANYVPAVTFVDVTDPPVKQCITDAVQKLSIAVTTGDLDLTVTHRS